MSIHLRAVGTAQVRDHNMACPDGDLQMMARDVWVRNVDVVVARSTEAVITVGQELAMEFLVRFYYPYLKHGAAIDYTNLVY